MFITVYNMLLSIWTLVHVPLAKPFNKERQEKDDAYSGMALVALS